MKIDNKGRAEGRVYVMTIMRQGFAENDSFVPVLAAEGLDFEGLINQWRRRHYVGSNDDQN